VLGRAGRVAQGRVYRLVNYQFYHEHLRDYCEPEMRVCHHSLLLPQSSSSSSSAVHQIQNFQIWVQT